MILVGDGPLRSEVTQHLLLLADRVFCPGYAAYSSLPFWFGIADVFVHPARNEPWGVSVNEALACGLPVVASDWVGAGVELVAPSGSGILFPAGDAEALADGLESLVLHPTLRADCVQRALDSGRAHASRATQDHLIAALQAR